MRLGEPQQVGGTAPGTLGGPLLMPDSGDMVGSDSVTNRGNGTGEAIGPKSWNVWG